jgi:hypothetical protein
MQNAVLTIKDVRAWLQAQPVDAVIGVRAHCARCPLAEYLYTVGYTNVEIGLTACWVNAVQYLLPHWAYRFIMQIDNPELQFRGPVTAGEALRVLDEVTQ